MAQYLARVTRAGSRAGSTGALGWPESLSGSGDADLKREEPEKAEKICPYLTRLSTSSRSHLNKGGLERSKSYALSKRAG